MATQPVPNFNDDAAALEPFAVEAATPRVTLRNAFAHPYDSAIAAARTCYAPRLIGPEDVNDKQRLLIGAATFYGGHHTVFQHAHFEFGLENVSRQFVWSFLHAHPFYNSEQQSQRYVRQNRAVAYVPAEGPCFGAAEREIYEAAIARAWGHYREIAKLLLPEAREILGDIWHVNKLSHPKRVKKVEGQADKRAIEVARYVLPVAAATTMVHTLSGIVLHRLWRMQAASDTPAESRIVIGEMVARARELDPFYAMQHALSSQAAFAAREYPAAVQFARQTIVVDPEFWIGHLQLAHVYVELGKTDLALDALNIAGRLSAANSKVIALRGYIFARTERRNEALEVLNILEAISRERYVPPYAIALVHAGLGQQDLALQWLERAYEARDVHLAFVPIDPKWDAFRTDTRFLAILNRCDFNASGLQSRDWSTQTAEKRA